MIFELDHNLIFPPLHLAEEDGLLAIGGDLSTARLILAYSNGVFPWFSDDTPILWYAPRERFVLFPEKLKVSKSMRQILRSGKFSITFDKAFTEVIKACALIERKDQDGTWITQDMQQAYTKLYEAGFAHSIEVWQGQVLVGGLYGVYINGVFCGESMFSKVSNASKIALIWLIENLEIKMVDCQIHSEHLASMGAEMVSMATYLGILKNTKSSL
ncbi:leucyl/phenylalanyl-tRNA--protein transferase [Pseudopedobacter beijingensis]|uniref:Leucyl/phenylalanyl-tRNA--protein transferase n=1 Tax=Pseudopedobacter beijingensis TaxID=1207056 RepID=A0ABW4IBF5_9SPHI